MEHKESTTQAIASEADESLGLQLSAEELEEISTHLEGCPPCLEFVESLKATVKMCRELGADEKPAPLDASTRQKMLDAYEAMLQARKERGL